MQVEVNDEHDEMQMSHVDVDDNDEKVEFDEKYWYYIDVHLQNEQSMYHDEHDEHDEVEHVVHEQHEHHELIDVIV